MGNSRGQDREVERVWSVEGTGRGMGYVWRGLLTQPGARGMIMKVVQVILF